MAPKSKSEMLTDLRKLKIPACEIGFTSFHALMVSVSITLRDSMNFIKHRKIGSATYTHFIRSVEGQGWQSRSTHKHVGNSYKMHAPFKLKFKRGLIH